MVSELIINPQMCIVLDAMKKEMNLFEKYKIKINILITSYTIQNDMIYKF